MRSLHCAGCRVFLASPWIAAKPARTAEAGCCSGWGCYPSGAAEYFSDSRTDGRTDDCWLSPAGLGLETHSSARTQRRRRLSSSLSSLSREEYADNNVDRGSQYVLYVHCQPVSQADRTITKQKIKSRVIRVQFCFQFFAHLVLLFFRLSLSNISSQACSFL